MGPTRKKYCTASDNILFNRLEFRTIFKIVNSIYTLLYFGDLGGNLLRRESNIVFNFVVVLD